MPLSSLERLLFELSLDNPWLFRHIIRPRLYKRNRNDPEAVHEYVLKMLSQADVIKVLERNKNLFETPEELKITVNGKRIAPFGTAAGMDKNGDAAIALSYVFGFQEHGTVVVPEREGNKRPRVATDNENEDLYNAQGFPSNGLAYYRKNIRYFREVRGNEPTVYASICGLPLSEHNAIEIAMQEMEQLLKELNPYVDGFAWNPFSPNTAALALFRTPKVFRETAELMKRHAAYKLLLVKMGPYEDDYEEIKQHLDLTNAFLEGGGHGIVAVNTKMFPKEQIRVPNWGYPSGGRSGRFLQPYRMRAVKDTCEAFPDAAIVATGGISDGDDAYETFKAGATMLEGFTPYTFYGPGLVSNLEKGVAKRLNQDGYRSLKELQHEVRFPSKRYSSVKG